MSNFFLGKSIIKFVVAVVVIPVVAATVDFGVVGVAVVDTVDDKFVNEIFNGASVAAVDDLLFCFPFKTIEQFSSLRDGCQTRSVPLHGLWDD